MTETDQQLTSDTLDAQAIFSKLSVVLYPESLLSTVCLFHLSCNGSVINSSADLAQKKKKPGHINHTALHTL